MHANASENIVFVMAVILARGRIVNSSSVETGMLPENLGNFMVADALAPWVVRP